MVRQCVGGEYDVLLVQRIVATVLQGGDDAVTFLTQQGDIQGHSLVQPTFGSQFMQQSEHCAVITFIDYAVHSPQISGI